MDNSNEGIAIINAKAYGKYPEKLPIILDRKITNYFPASKEFLNISVLEFWI